MPTNIRDPRTIVTPDAFEVDRATLPELDGERMSWWAAFEPRGGYVAGIATGLLGFAQLLWDPNRQCIHDKIVGTVVVVDRAAPIPGAWEEAFGVSESESGLTDQRGEQRG